MPCIRAAELTGNNQMLKWKFWKSDSFDEFRLDIQIFQ